MVTIKTPVVVTHRQKGDIEAWLYTGQPFEEWPDWVQSHYGYGGRDPKNARSGNWALRDDEGFFWKWMHPEHFDRAYEPISA